MRRQWPLLFSLVEIKTNQDGDVKCARIAVIDARGAPYIGQNAAHLG